MITDLLAQFIYLFTRLLALLFMLRGLGQLLGRPTLGPVLRPFASWMNPVLDQVRQNTWVRRAPFDLAPVLVAFVLLVVGSGFAELF